ALENFDKLSEDARRTSMKLNKSWEDIGKIVYDTIMQNFKRFNFDDGKSPSFRRGMKAEKLIYL
ncbi:MAG: hypothetical protein QXV57_03540, partial [Thermoproteota archaeon]